MKHFNKILVGYPLYYQNAVNEIHSTLNEFTVEKPAFEEKYRVYILVVNESKE